jgi:hypothetical protein
VVIEVRAGELRKGARIDTRLAGDSQARREWAAFAFCLASRKNFVHVGCIGEILGGRWRRNFSLGKRLELEGGGGV